MSTHSSFLESRVTAGDFYALVLEEFGRVFDIWDVHVLQLWRKRNAFGKCILDVVYRDVRCVDCSER